MAFFDDLGKKISQASQDVAQQNMGTTGVAKINKAIKAEEDNIRALYSQIGIEYINLHFTDPEPALKEMVDKVMASFAKIEEYKAEIEAIKGIIRCESCGAELQKGTNFCSICGAKIASAPVAAATPAPVVEAVPAPVV